MLCDGLVKGRDGYLGHCRNTIGDLMGREVFARTRKCELHHSAGEEATGNSTNSDRSVFFIGLVADKETRPSGKVGTILANVAFSYKEQKRMESSEARVVNRLARARPCSLGREVRDGRQASRQVPLQSGCLCGGGCAVGASATGLWRWKVRWDGGSGRAHAGGEGRGGQR